MHRQRRPGAGRDGSERGGHQPRRRRRRDATGRIRRARPGPRLAGAGRDHRRGGDHLDHAVRRWLREPFVVWLQAEPATLASRVTADPLRPLLGDQPQAVLETLDRKRRALYGEVADLVLSVDRLDPADIAARIAAHLSDPPG